MVNVLTLRVVPTPRDAGGGFHVEIWIDGTELTSSTAGLGMDARQGTRTPKKMRMT